MPLYGPYPVSEIGRVIQADTMGVYLLSRDGGRHAHYAGRSDYDLQGRLRSSAGVGPYTHFWFAYESSPMRAYQDECALYHSYAPPDNLAHPAVPPGTYWRCPIREVPLELSEHGARCAARPLDARLRFP